MRVSLFALFGFLAAWVLLGPTMPTAATQKTGPKKPAPKPAALVEARQRLLRGNYEEARKGFEDLAKADEKLQPITAVGLAQIHRLSGEYDQAMAVLDAAKKAAPQNADLLAARADLLYELGRWDDAEKDADDAISKQEYQLLARWTKARILRERGKLTEADGMFRSVVRYYTKRSNDDDDITDAEELLVVAQCGAENARWHNLSKQFSFILNEVIADALKGDKDYWPAELLAGQMLLEKYNRPDAIDAFNKANKLNPKAADPFVGLGEAALVKFDLKEAEGYADQALKQNPKHPGALRLKADIQILAGDFPAAEKLLATAQSVNPRDSATLGRLAALYWMTQRKPQFEAMVKDVESFDAKPGSFYHELAAVLEERKQYTKAEEFYKKAAELRPNLAGPRTGLGMLQMRMGNEPEARKLLDAAFKLDPFNVKVSNSRKVLDHLDKYETIQTAHYELRFDPKTDKVLAAFLAEFLEDTHAMLKKQFSGYEPPSRVLIEVFSTHEMFSGRTVGVPDLHTIGACTGKVVAMASPRAKGVAKPFNWGRVMRHELTHIFNLAQTEFQCPHWLTEGLAVRNENMNRPQSWSQILRDRFAANDLLNLDTIMLGFVRPRSPEEWTLAYCQSQLYVDYVVAAHGEAAIGKLLDGYKTSADNATVLKTALGVDKAAFEAGYRKHVEQVVAGLRSTGKAKPPEMALTFDELTAAVEKNPNDLQLKARLAEASFRRNMVGEAKKLADEVLGKEATHPLASTVRAKLLLRAGDDDGAKAALQNALKGAPDDPKLLMLVARMHLDAKDYASAAQVLEQGRKVAPLDGDWLEQLARVYKASGDKNKLIPVLREWTSQDPDELDGRIQLAKLFVEVGQPAEAEPIARDAIQIDVMSEPARAILLDVLKALKKDAEVQKLEQRFGK
jgi:tetratricopeptide (TPR) repeat protein